MASSVARRVGVLAGTAVQWGADRFAFAFNPLDTRAVFGECVQLLSEFPELAIGLAEGELMFGEVEGASRLWGVALVLADAFAAAANPGEALVHTELELVRGGELAGSGMIPVRVGGVRHSALLVLGSLVGAGPQSHADRQLDSEPGWDEPVRGRSTLPPKPSLRNRAPQKPPSLPPNAQPPRGLQTLPPPKPSADPQGTVDVDVELMEQLVEPSSSSSRPIPRPAEPTDEAEDRPSSVIPLKNIGVVVQSGAGQKRPNSVVEDLRQGRPDSVLELADRLKVSGEPSPTGRLEALAQLAQGERSAGLDTLGRRVWDAVDADSRALLALAVGLAVVGENEEALIAGLNGLRKARELQDVRGEKACITLIVQAADAAGEKDVAKSWAKLAAAL